MRQSTIKKLQQQVHESHERRLGRKLDAVLLREQGKTYPEISKCFGESQRTIKRWVRSYDLYGIDGLREKRSGRPTELTAAPTRQGHGGCHRGTGERWPSD